MRLKEFGRADYTIRIYNIYTHIYVVKIKVVLYKLIGHELFEWEWVYRNNNG